MESENLLLTENQAAKLLNISGKTLSKIRKRGEVVFVPVGRAIRYEVEALRDLICRFRTIAAT